MYWYFFFFFFFQAEDGIRDLIVTGVQTCALPICGRGKRDRLADLGDRGDDGLPGWFPRPAQVGPHRRPWAAVVPRDPELLADPEYQEQTVVGARAEDQDDHQELGDRRYLEAVLGRRGDQWP